MVSVGGADKGGDNSFVKVRGSPNEYEAASGQKGGGETTWAKGKTEKVGLSNYDIYHVVDGQ